MKAIKSKTLAREIDKLHGIEPALCAWIDAKIVNLVRTGGSTNPSEVGTSSIASIRKRIEMLEKCSEIRTREVAGIKEMAISIQEELNKKFDSLIHRIDMKVYEKCGSKFDAAEYKIMKVLKDELGFLATPTVFKHPPEGVENIDSGAKSFLAALNSTIKPNPYAKTPQNKTSLLPASSPSPFLSMQSSSSASTVTQKPADHAEHILTSLNSSISANNPLMVAGGKDGKTIEAAVETPALPTKEKDLTFNNESINEESEHAIMKSKDNFEQQVAVQVTTLVSGPVLSSKEEITRSNSIPPPLQIDSGDMSSIKEDFQSF